MSQPSPYFLLAVFAGVALMVGLAPLLIARLWALKFSPPRPGRVKNSVYECGMESKGDSRIQFKAGYYLYAILFLVFDVEAVFLLPFSAAFTALPAAAFVAIMVFLLLLVEGLAWAWMKGVLTWQP